MRCPRSLAGALPIVALVAAATPATAATSFGLKALGAPRGYFVLHAAPGARVRGRVRVINAGKQTGVAVLQPADALTGRTTGVVYETKAIRDVGRWIGLDRPRVTLRPGQEAVVGFTVQVPSSAAPGDHLGGIVAEPEAAETRTARGKAQHSFHVNVVEQSIVAVQVVTPGAARSELRLTGLRAGADPGFQTLLIGIRNPGHRLVKGSGIVKVLDGSGTVLRRQPFTVDTFVPGTSVQDPVVVRGKVLPAGTYQASVIIRWPGGHSTTLHAPFAVTSKQVKQVFGSPGPPSAVGGGGKGGGPSVALIVGGGVALLLLGIGGSAWYFRRKVRQAVAERERSTD